MGEKKCAAYAEAKLMRLLTEKIKRCGKKWNI